MGYRSFATAWLGTVAVVVIGFGSVACAQAGNNTITGMCLADRFGSALGCTATDVRMSDIRVGGALIDGCDFTGDTATFEPSVDLTATPTRRDDIGLYLAMDGGNALNGTCSISTLPHAPNGGMQAPYAGPYFDLDGDACGDISSLGPSIVNAPIAAITIPCFDADGNGIADMRYCLMWQSPSSVVCTSPADAVPTSPSRCGCGIGDVQGLPISSQVIEVRKALNPASDPGVFHLRIDGVIHAAAVGDQGTTGYVPVAVGNHVISEVAAAGGTVLSEYETSIECVERVGRCSGDNAVTCLTSTHCGSAGVCNLSPTIVATCSGCTELSVSTPVAASTVTCTINNIGYDSIFLDGFDDSTR